MQLPLRMGGTVSLAVLLSRRQLLVVIILFLYFRYGRRIQEVQERTKQYHSVYAVVRERCHCTSRLILLVCESVDITMPTDLDNKWL